ncbi:MAG TPA: leucyl aminopeptidase [Candidatus Omnitrophota bacterium]|nr:leucyl aminopeptidase [Candidatus Omnitrophota bacterium]HPS36611.1 leucyl aminopeptidase [Candidatus Omnitrophota bacterium]
MKVSLTNLTKSAPKADLFVIGYFKGEKDLTALRKIDPVFAKAAEAAIAKKIFSGKAGEVFSSFQTGYRQASETALLGLGGKKDLKVASLRKAVGSVVALASGKKAAKVRVFLDSFLTDTVSAEQAAGIFTEISFLASYRFDKYKTQKKNEPAKTPASIELVTEQKEAVKEMRSVMVRSGKISAAVLLARDLNNEPGNIMNPPRLAQEAKKIAAEKKLSCQVFGLAELKKMGMNGILAVNQGSPTPPVLIALEYGIEHKDKGTVCLIGKGVTFDTGGISIKPSKSMEEMKYDKSGAIAVIATMALAAELKLPLHIVGLAPCVENNVANDPQRPGDIIKMFNGKTVEVMNTDAEGRLILADALSYAAKYEPQAILDAATLTGMCHHTFGDKTSGILGNDQKLIDGIVKAGEKTGERCWQLPLWEEYGECIKSHHSDLKNVGDGYAGTITATMFLKEFVPAKTPWVHLDIAGVANITQNRFDCPKGATGYGVRLFAEILSNWGPESFSKAE